ncbi:DNA polymerase III subunit psi [Shewanella xiamenensis]|uniref:DNA polymerase III subunit psi n=1 Tax=Shewanella xiamenensis TaxID=332186 RepID=UPI0024A66602|nr:DNA polymerase III subunit psi [Shewanella xiamenensis]MDI5848194.1 DNA polymerase III subunit psi [Shewanella xiamenensis]
MNKSAYLAAMEITPWQLRDTKVRPYQVVLDVDDMSSAAEPLIDTVLGLIGISKDDCEFNTEPHKGKTIVWDLRRHRVRPRVAWLVSDPLADLLSHSEAKRALWGQICQWREQQLTA